jgi:hypothetical protein
VLPLNFYPPNCSPGAGQALPALRLAVRGFLFVSVLPIKPTRQYLLRALFSYFQHFKELFFGSRLALALLLATSPLFSLRAGKILAEKSGGAPDRAPAGGNDFFKQNGGVPSGGNDFVATGS